LRREAHVAAQLIDQNSASCAMLPDEGVTPERR
jgi:hypothetical protein